MSYAVLSIRCKSASRWSMHCSRRPAAVSPRRWAISVRVIRARKALRLKARALTLEAKASAAVLAALPFVVGGAMYVVNRDLGSALFVDPRGRFMIGVAFLSLVTGLSTMAVLVKRAPR